MRCGRRIAAGKGTVAVIAKTCFEPAPGALGIAKRLGGGESLRRDDEKRGLGQKPDERRVEIGRIDIGDEMQPQAGLAEAAQRAHSHARSEIGSADTDVDDVGDRFAGCADERAAVRFADEGAHAFARRPHHRHDVGHNVGHAIASLRKRVRVRAQSHMQHCAAFGIVDGFA